MSNMGDDCYFYYYSACTKGETCPFRHCEAARGNENVCTLWQENRCFRNVCKFRHMEIKKNRKEIPCYWEKQPGGCQKVHCAFHHEKPRFIDGLFVAPDKGAVVTKEKEEESPKDDHVSSAPANISNTTKPQLRAVIKVETQESAPSPTHPPVVINPVDDEDDEDDQFSEEGEEASGVSPKKLLSSSRDASLDFGIKTLEEIRLRKALKASLKRPGQPFDCITSAKRSRNGSGTEKETIRSVMPAAVIITTEFPALEDTGKKKITDRLGKRSDEDLLVEGGLQLKGSLAKRLGGFVDSTENKINMPPRKVKTLRSVHERLGLTPEITAPKSPNSEPKPSGEIRIKTLEEIRQEKAAKSQIQAKGLRVVTDVPTNELIFTKKVNKPVIAPSVKTFSEVLREKKKLQETKVVPQKVSTSTEKSEEPTNTGGIKLTAQAAEIRVKTLEEIRKEKAARMQAKVQDTTNDDAPTLADAVPKRRILCSGKTGSAINISSQKGHDSEKVDCIEESTVTNGKSDDSIQDVTVKSFEEIMREKRLRKQQEQAAPAVEPEQIAQKPIPLLLEKKSPSVSRPEITIQASSSIHQASSVVPSAVSQRKSPEMQNKKCSLTTSPKKSKLASSMALPVRESKMADSSHLQEPHVTRMPPSTASELKVRPKLNVKPSVMKPAARVKPGQKRKATGNLCSAVAAVKPLNAVPDPDLEPPSKIKVSAPSCSLEVEAQVQQVSSPAEQCSLDPISVPQSPVIKAQTQTRQRRASLASGRGTTTAGNASTMDDFDDLLDEFTDDRLEDEIELDPGKGEDDLLLELSEMIDS